MQSAEHGRRDDLAFALDESVRALHAALVDGQLLAQRRVLEDELGAVLEREATYVFPRRSTAIARGKYVW